MKIIKNLILITILTLSFTNCTNEEVLNEEKTQETYVDLSNDYVKLNYTSSVDKNGMLNVSIENLNKSTQYKLKLDVTSAGYRLDISQSLEQYSRNWMKDIELMESKLLAQSILEYVNKYNNPADFQKEEMQGLFYIMSVFNAINRYHEISTFKSSVANTILQITAYDGYITGLTPYKAKEDIILNISDFENWLNSYSGSRLLDRDIVYIKEKINGLQNLSLKEYQNLVHEPLNNKNKSNSLDDDDDCWFLCGGDCGCCGNYEGQCYFGEMLCYTHDYLCETCEPRWFCFDGCKPTPC